MSEAPLVSSFGKYRLIASLARGGMARVYLGLMAGPAGFNKLLVLKILRGGVLGDTADAVHMFMNEARLAARIVHPNVVQTYEVGEVDGRHYLAMEYVEGQTYRTLQTRAGVHGIALPDELRILIEVARGLHALHELCGFDGAPLHAVHRDVSPQNVLVGYDGQVKLLDFGIAKTTDPSHWTQSGVIKGKIDYIAPEQLCGHAVDRRADVFALGVMLWEAIAGARFAGGSTLSEAAKAQARLTGGEPNVRTLKRDVPELLAAVIERAIALDPEARFPDAAAFADALEAQLEVTGQRPQAKTLSAQMNSLFEAERDKLRKLVENQLESAKRALYSELSTDATGALPRLELKDARTGSTMWSRVPGSGAHLIPRSGKSAAATLLPSKASRLRPRSWAVVLGASAIAGALAWFTPSSEHVTATQSELSPTPSAAAEAPAVSERASQVGAGGQATSSLAAQTVATNAKADPSAPLAGEPAQELGANTAGSAASKPASLAPSPVDAELVRVDFQIVPLDARVTLDGIALAMPFSGELPRDTALHDLRAAAPGYLPFRQLVGFDRDRKIEITLTRAQPAKRPPAASPVAKGAPEPLGIDVRDPYAKTRHK